MSFLWESSYDPPRPLHTRGFSKLAKVLIVDDDSQCRRAMRIALIAGGHEVSEAADGQEALDKMSVATVDVVLLDWQMPVMDGEKACRAMRAVSLLPIIVIAGSDREKEALAAGATGFFRKPVDVCPLLARIEVCTSAAGATPRQSPQT